MRCRSCNVLNMHARGKRVTRMRAPLVVGVNEVNCLGMLGCGMLGQLLICCSVNVSICLRLEVGLTFYSLTFLNN